jgi:hypothetical protein
VYRKTLMVAAATAIAATTTTGAIAAASPAKTTQTRAAPETAVTRLDLTPSSSELARCMPNPKVRITVESTAPGEN